MQGICSKNYISPVPFSITLLIQHKYFKNTFAAILIGQCSYSEVNVHLCVRGFVLHRRTGFDSPGYLLKLTVFFFHFLSIICVDDITIALLLFFSLDDMPQKNTCYVPTCVCKQILVVWSNSSTFANIRVCDILQSKQAIRWNQNWNPFPSLKIIRTRAITVVMHTPRCRLVTGMGFVFTQEA